MRSRRFIQCDVFSPVPGKGNALAVVVDGQGLSDEQMQQFANWTNLAETTFLVPPQDPAADYRVRIYTPTREMPFAGHPTLGSCASWLESGGRPHNRSRVRQQCGVGIVEIDTSKDSELSFTAPPTKIGPMNRNRFTSILKALEIPADRVLQTAELDNGPVWQVLELDSARDVLAVDSSHVRWPDFRSIGLIGAYPGDAECDYEVRMLAPSSGMSEDPITGSLNSALAHWLQADGRLTGELTIAQGTVIGRHGRVFVRPGENDAVHIGGQVHILVEGSVTL